MARDCCGIRSHQKQSTTSRAFDELFQVVDVASGEELWEREFSESHGRPAVLVLEPGWQAVVVVGARTRSRQSPMCNCGTATPERPWRSSTGKLPAPIIDSTIDFSPDSQLLAVVSVENEIYVWEVAKLPLAAGATPLRIAAPHLTLQTGGGEGIGRSCI